MRNNCQAVWNKVTTVASNLGIEIKLPPGGSSALRRCVSFEKVKKSFQGAYYRTFIFFAIIDNVIAGLTVRFIVVKRIKELFDGLWNYLDLSSTVTDQKARISAGQYGRDVNEENLVTEMQNLLFVHSANFGNTKLLPLDLLNKIYNFKLQ